MRFQLFSIPLVYSCALSSVCQSALNPPPPKYDFWAARAILINFHFWEKNSPQVFSLLLCCHFWMFHASWFFFLFFFSEFSVTKVKTQRQDRIRKRIEFAWAHFMWCVYLGHLQFFSVSTIGDSTENLKSTLVSENTNREKEDKFWMRAFSSKCLCSLFFMNLCSRKRRSKFQEFFARIGFLVLVSKANLAATTNRLEDTECNLEACSMVALREKRVLLIGLAIWSQPIPIHNV